MARMKEAEGQRREYTLERIRTERPEVIGEVIHLRSQWVAIRKIAKVCNLAADTVLAICAEYADQLRDEFKRRVTNLRNAGDRLVEEILDSPEKVPWSVKAQAAAVLYEKGELLEGRATARTEHVHRVDLFSNCGTWEEFVASIDDQNSVRTSIDKMPPETHLPGQKNSPENPPLALPEPDPENP
jgi:hypothetical protein